jgi:hypothetical protein
MPIEREDDWKLPSEGVDLDTSTSKSTRSPRAAN